MTTENIENLAKTNLPKPTVVVQEGKACLYQTEKSKQVFYNPVQEFNRDLSVAVIQTFCDQLKKNKTTKERGGIHLLEALSATGLRSIRYAKEIPDLASITANDLSRNSVETIKLNVKFNEIQDKVSVVHSDANLLMQYGITFNQNVTSSTDTDSIPKYVPVGGLKSPASYDIIDLDPYGTPSIFLDSAMKCAKEGTLLCVTATDMAVLCGNSSHKCLSQYGVLSNLKSKSCHELALRILLSHIASTAVKHNKAIHPLLSLSVDFYVRIFVQVFRNSSILRKKSGVTEIEGRGKGAGSRVTENDECCKQKSGATENDECCKEKSGVTEIEGRGKGAGSRVTENDECCKEKSGATENDECSKDESGATEIEQEEISGYDVVNVGSRLGYVYQCGQCESLEIEHAMKLDDRGKLKMGHVKIGQTCEICTYEGGKNRVGPIWIAPIHDFNFVHQLLENIKEKTPDDFKTLTRMEGVLNVVSEELHGMPLYVLQERMCGVMKTPVIPMLQFRSAILNGGYRVSLSHANPHAIKTDAPNTFIWAIIRKVAEKHHQENRQNSCQTSQTLKNVPSNKPKSFAFENILTNGILFEKFKDEINFKEHPLANPESRKCGLRRFQVNPEKFWGPKSKGRSHEESLGDQDRSSRPRDPAISKQIRNQGGRTKRRKLKQGEPTT